MSFTTNLIKEKIVYFINPDADDDELKQHVKNLRRVSKSKFKKWYEFNFVDAHNCFTIGDLKCYNEPMLVRVVDACVDDDYIIDNCIVRQFCDTDDSITISVITNPTDDKLLVFHVQVQDEDILHHRIDEQKIENDIIKEIIKNRINSFQEENRMLLGFSTYETAATNYGLNSPVFWNCDPPVKLSSNELLACGQTISEIFTESYDNEKDFGGFSEKVVRFSTKQMTDDCNIRYYWNDVLEDPDACDCIVITDEDDKEIIMIAYHTD